MTPRLAPATPTEECDDLNTKEISASDSLKPESTPEPKRTFSTNQKIFAKGFVIVSLIMVMFLLQGNVPDNDIECLIDKIQDLLEPMTAFLMTPGNEMWRTAFQTICSVLMDITFFLTFGYWLLKGQSSTLVVALCIFYLVRGLVQLMFFLPYPPLYYWDSPQFPSLVVPYGKASDFFFSGHSGFVVLCANEWHKIGFKKMRNLVMLVGVYTVWVLLVYRIHYSIDVFTGLFFADWVYSNVDKHKDIFDNFFSKVGNEIRDVWNLATNWPIKNNKISS